jgi:hypothetical protein
VSAADRVFAGFLPALDPFAGLSTARDEVRSASALVAERRIDLQDAADTAARLMILVGTFSGVDARLGLCSHLLQQMRPLTLRTTNEQHPPADFRIVEVGSGTPSFAAFGHHNVVVALWNTGANDLDVVGSLKQLAWQLACDPLVRLDEVADHRPRIEVLQLTASEVRVDASIPVVFQARCPRGLPLTLGLRASPGAVRQISSEPPRFVFDVGGTPGRRRVAASAVNSACGQALATFEFTAGLGALSAPPGVIAQ